MTQHEGQVPDARLERIPTFAEMADLERYLDGKPAGTRAFLRTEFVKSTNKDWTVEAVRRRLEQR